jgi:Tyrosine phosphatase family
VNAGGLPQLYEILLDSAMKEICQGLKVGLCNLMLPAGWPPIDRLHCCGISVVIDWQQVTMVQIIRAAAERGEATLFFCKIGKDRTGLMAALTLAACGATNDEIISDYNR